MQMIKPAYIVSIVFIAILALAVDFYPKNETEKTLPLLEIAALDDSPSRVLPKQKGLQIINIFASWCETCAVEMPLLVEMAEKWQIELTGVAWKDDRMKAAAFLERNGNPYIWIGMDTYGVKLSTWNVSGVPETLVILDGRIVYRQRGELSRRIIQDMIAPVVLDSRHK